jgi:hypothetical protein
MHKKSRQELYREFLQFVEKDARSLRRSSNRRMVSVFLWCFIFPALISLVTIVGIRVGWLPSFLRAYLEWVILLFPVLYSLYILGTEVLRDVPAAFRRGGVAGTLRQFEQESHWRDKTCADLKAAIQASSQDWGWVVFCFARDLDALKYRNRYLSVLSAAVFFIILEGLDMIGGDAEGVAAFSPQDMLRLFGQFSGQVSQLIALSLFLLLLYMAGMQLRHLLLRYQMCAQLLAED